MLDTQLLRKELNFVVEKLKKRNFDFNVDNFLKLEQARKELQSTTQQLQSERNQIAKQIGIAKSKAVDVRDLMQKSHQINQELSSIEAKLQNNNEELNMFLQIIPNLPDDSVPQGKDSKENKIIKTWGNIRNFDFPIRDHVELGEYFTKTSNGLDFTNAAKIAGARFVIIQGSLAKLHRALTQFMLEIHTTEHRYLEVNTPYMVNPDSAFGTGQLPKFEEDLFKIELNDSDENKNKKYYLIPTAEVSVTNIVRNEIIEGKELPLKFVCHSPCFRSEAGSYGKDTRGMIRQHQFDKVELVQIVNPEKSWDALEELTRHAEVILEKLELAYQKVVLSTGDMGFAAAKTYDLEVWLPSQSTYREISSCSNYLDFQARRMKSRFRNQNGKTDMVHTLNGSGLAVGRTLVAILENYQQQDGSIIIPNALKNYLGGAIKIDSSGHLSY